MQKRALRAVREVYGAPCWRSRGTSACKGFGNIATVVLLPEIKRGGVVLTGLHGDDSCRGKSLELMHYLMHYLRPFCKRE